jgi:acetaldehyde dehydrogenase (acetylating)
MPLRSKQRKSPRLDGFRAFFEENQCLAREREIDFGKREIDLTECGIGFVVLEIVSDRYEIGFGESEIVFGGCEIDFPKSKSISGVSDIAFAENHIVFAGTDLSSGASKILFTGTKIVSRMVGAFFHRPKIDPDRF